MTYTVPWYIVNPWFRFGRWMLLAGMIGLVLFWIRVIYEYDHPDRDDSKPYGLKAAFIIHFAIYFGMLFSMTYPTFIIQISRILTAPSFMKVIFGENAVYLAALVINIILSVLSFAVVFGSVIPKEMKAKA